MKLFRNSAFSRREVVTTIAAIVVLGGSIAMLLVNKNSNTTAGYWIMGATLLAAIMGMVLAKLYDKFEEEDYGLDVKRNKYIALRTQELEGKKLSLFQKLWVENYLSLRKWLLREQVEFIAAFLSENATGGFDAYLGVYTEQENVMFESEFNKKDVFAKASTFESFLPELHAELLKIKENYMASPDFIDRILDISGLRLEFDGQVVQLENKGSITKEEAVYIRRRFNKFAFSLVVTKPYEIDFILSCLKKNVIAEHKPYVYELPKYNVVQEQLEKIKKSEIKPAPKDKSDLIS